MRTGGTSTGAARTALALGLLVAACQPTASPSTPAASAETVELTIFGAASLQDALAEMETAYEAAVPGTTLVTATDSSAALRTQIEEGAPADVFLAADTANPEALFDAGLTAGRPNAFIGNTLALVVPADNPAEIRSPADLAMPGVGIIAAGPEVPITAYAAEVVANLAALSDYPTSFADAYAANVVSEEDNVRGVLTKVELREGDAGFVYLTDALASSEVISIPIPEEANTIATYEGCVIQASPHVEEAQAFLAWVENGEGGAILADFGFVMP